MNKDTEASTPASWLDLVTKHFVVLSAATTLAAITFSTIFVFGYLSIFDWRIIWFVEASDLAKFGVLAIAFLTAAFLF